jgi:ribosomal protein S18 acetylase RimI-like enzyme
MFPHQAASGATDSEEELLRKVLENYECAEVLVQGELPVGLLKICREGRNWELSQIQIIRSLQRKGIGTRLIRELVKEAQTAGATIRLKTLKSNPARHLYSRLGFIVFAEKAHSVEMMRAPTPANGFAVAAVVRRF